jgi:hypothetical protein
MVWVALVAPLVALTDVGDNRIRSLLLRLHGRRKCVFRLDRNRVALSLEMGLQNDQVCLDQVAFGPSIKLEQKENMLVGGGF